MCNKKVSIQEQAKRAFSSKLNELMIYYCRKTEGVNYLSDWETKGVMYPGPGSHEADTAHISVMKKHSSSVTMRVPSRGLSKEWKFKKSEMPDCGSYEIDKASHH